MGKAQSPLLGFNNNVRHRGRVFHIQTEDSGIKYPHVITHLFADGGRILKSIKTSYSEYLGSETLQETVRNLMKEQHKSMFIALRDGQFDELLDEGTPKAPARPAEAKPAKSGASPAAKPEPAADPTAKPEPAEPAAKPEPAEPDSAPKTKAQASGENQVDVDVLERAATAAQNRSPLFGDEEMPPPPLRCSRAGARAVRIAQWAPNPPPRAPTRKPKPAGTQPPAPRRSSAPPVHPNPPAPYSEKT